MFILTMTFCVMLPGEAADCGTRTFSDYEFDNYESCAEGADLLNDYLELQARGLASYSAWLCRPPGKMAGS